MQRVGPIFHSIQGLRHGRHITTNTNFDDTMVYFYLILLERLMKGSWSKTRATRSLTLHFHIAQTAQIQ